MGNRLSPVLTTGNRNYVYGLWMVSLFTVGITLIIESKDV